MCQISVSSIYFTFLTIINHPDGTVILGQFQANFNCNRTSAGLKSGQSKGHNDPGRYFLHQTCV